MHAYTQKIPKTCLYVLHYILNVRLFRSGRNARVQALALAGIIRVSFYDISSSGSVDRK